VTNADKPQKYKSVKTGNVLLRCSGKFHYRGRDFHGLVDLVSNALYDDPDDSFADHVGLDSSLKKGLIEPVKAGP
jgi:hypothetical protein